MAAILFSVLERSNNYVFRDIRQPPLAIVQLAYYALKLDVLK